MLRCTINQQPETKEIMMATEKIIKNAFDAKATHTSVGEYYDMMTDAAMSVIKQAEEQRQEVEKAGREQLERTAALARTFWQAAPPAAHPRRTGRGARGH